MERRFKEKGYQLIGGFFFLRFVCPALVTPERIGLAQGGMRHMKINTAEITSHSPCLASSVVK